MEAATNREMIAKVRGLFKLNSQDTLGNIPDRMILSELQSTTIAKIKQVTDRRKLWNSPNIFTTLSCLQLKQVPLADCCSYASPTTVARTLVQLPKIAEGTNFGMLIQGLYSIDTVSRRFIESTPDRYVNSLKLGLQTDQLHFWIQEKYLYIGSTTIERVKISAFFEEDIPESLISYPDYCSEPASVLKGCCPSSQYQAGSNGYDKSACCPINSYDKEFQAPGYLVPVIIDEVISRLNATYKRSIDDKVNDGKDDSK